jgi:hypothetical protein
MSYTSTGIMLPHTTPSCLVARVNECCSECQQQYFLGKAVVTETECGAGLKSSALRSKPSKYDTLNRAQQTSRSQLEKPASCESGLASSSTGRNPRAEGPRFRKMWKGLRPADRSFGPKRGRFDQFSRQNALVRPQRPLWGAADRNWPRPFHQLVEFSKRSLRALL